ncbi:MAG TPA: M23 family metallopeptidase [Candidatus Limnocylindrales bacterium]|nr:M23 family metallopeptidase [Candidatus Limnocylindrales bacterium]
MRRHRHLRLGVVAISLGFVASLSATLPGAEPRPVSEVRGAAATLAPLPSASPAPYRDSRFDYPRTTEREMPRSGRDALAPQPGELTGYVWPLARGRITLPFKAIPGGSRIKDGERFHDGLDMATFCGDRVRAAHDGVVLAAGREFDEYVGWIGDLRPYYAVLDRKKLWDDLPIVVVIDDGNGYRSIYAHFSKVSVVPGDRVRAGQIIGLEGATGHASGCHVHYGLFSPLETETFGVRDDILKRLKLPPLEIARIDPILVMPDGAEALRLRRFPVPSPAAATPSPEAPPASAAP